VATWVDTPPDPRSWVSSRPGVSLRRANGRCYRP